MTEFDKTENECKNINALIAAVEQWYIHSPGHDIGTDLNKVAVAYVRLKAGTGASTDRPDLPPIDPGMLASPNAQPGAQEPDTESLDALERAGRLALVEETRKAWMGREVQEPTGISTSGYIAMLPDPIADDARQAYDNRYHKVRAAVSFDSWLRAYRHFVGLDVAAVKGSDIEALALTNDPHWAAGTLPFDQVG